MTCTYSYTYTYLSYLHPTPTARSHFSADLLKAQDQVVGSSQTVTRNLFCFFFSRPFGPFPSFPFPCLFPHRSGPSNPAKGFGGALLSPPAGENHICSHQTRFMGSKYTKNAFAAVYRAQATCLLAANVVLFLLSEICKIEAS